MIIMHSLFDLDAACSDTDFQLNIDSFTRHLVEKNLLVSSRFMKRQAHPGYNADAPSAPYYLAMEFTDMEQAEICWTYIESDEEPVKTLHNAVKSCVRDSSFFLCRDV